MCHRCKIIYSAKLQARAMVHDEVLEAAEACRKKADEVEAVNRAAGFAHLAPDVLREKAVAYQSFADILRVEIEPAMDEAAKIAKAPHAR